MQELARAHPVTILSNLWRVFYLTIIPVIRGFLGALQGDLSSWMRGAWVDILILLFMIAVAVWRWSAVRYGYDDDHIRVTTGVIFRRHTRIPWRNVVTLSVVKPFTLRPFRAVRLQADTLGGRAKDSDFSILLRPDQADQLMSTMRESPSSGKTHRDYQPSTQSILALALLTSNSFVGIVFIATFVSQAGKLLGNEFSDLLIGTVEEAARSLAFGIPPAAAVLAYLLLAGWMAAFLLTYIRYKDITISHRERILHVSGGAFTHREYCISNDNINFIDIRQSLFTRMLNLYSLYIYAVGYGKQKNDLSCVIPTEGRLTFSGYCNKLLPGFSPHDRQIKPYPTGILRFIAQPLVPCLGIPLLMGVLIWIFPSWKTFILFMGLMSTAPALVFLIIRFIDFRTGGFAFDGTNFTLRYSKGFSIHTVVVPATKIALVDLRQSLFQRRHNCCDLRVYTEAEGRNIHMCRNLSREQLQALFAVHIFDGTT